MVFYTCDKIISKSKIFIILLQKKIILQTGNSDGSVSVIDVVPLENSDSSNDDQLSITVTDSVASTNGSSGQQVTAQVAVVQAQSPGDTGPHYITVTGKSFYFYYFFIYFCWLAIYNLLNFMLS